VSEIGVQTAKLTLKPSKLKSAVVLAVCLCLIVTAALIDAPGEEAVRWFTIIVVSLTAVVFLPSLLGIVELQLDSEGFTLGSILRRRRCAWRDCSEFSVVRGPAGSVVGFADRAHNSGAPRILTDRFGMDAADLAAIMNRFRDSALKDAT
jgi:hypothetical protein